MIIVCIVPFFGIVIQGTSVVEPKPFSGSDVGKDQLRIQTIFGTVFQIKITLYVESGSGIGSVSGEHSSSGSAKAKSFGFCGSGSATLRGT